MNDLDTIIGHIREHPECADSWLELSGWLKVNGCDDESAAVQTLYPAMQDVDCDRLVMEAALALVTRHADLVGRAVRR